MPSTLTGTAGAVDITVQVPADGDPANGASLIPGFQRCADNAKRLLDIVTTTGASAVRQVADIAALQALSGMTDGQAALVKKRGLYVYVDPDVTSPLTNWIVAPSLGTGNWFHINYLLRNVAYGIVALDAAAKVPVANLPNTLLASTYQDAPTPVSVTTGFVDLTSGTFSGVKENDIIEVTGVVQFTHAAGSPGYTVNARARVSSTNLATVVAATVQAASFDYATVPVSGRYVCTAGDETAGTVTWRVQGADPLSGGSITGKATGVRATHVRP